MGLLGRQKAPPPPEPALGDGSAAPTMLELVSENQPAAMVAALVATEGVDRIDSNGWTCLHHASSLGAMSHVEALLDAGADVGRPTAAPSGSFAKGMSPVDVAQQVQRTGQGDRGPVLRMLFWAAQAKGWTNWRELQRADASGSSQARGRTAARGSSAQDRETGGGERVTSQSEEEERIREQLRGELAVRDARAKAAEQELAEMSEKCTQAEGRLTVVQKRHTALEKKCVKLKKKVKEADAAGKQITELTVSLDKARTMLADAEARAAEWEQLASEETRARALDTRRAAAAAAALEEQRRHKTANKAIRRMMKIQMARAFEGWTWALSERRRRQMLLTRATARLANRSLAKAYDWWATWAGRSKVDLDAALEAAEANTRRAVATKVRTHRLEEQLQASQLELRDVREIMTREVKARTEADMRVSALEQQLSVATIARASDAETLQQLRGKLQDTASELQMQRDRLVTAHAELEDALTFGRHEQAKVQTLEEDLENARQEVSRQQSELAQQREKNTHAASTAERERLRLVQVVLDAEVAAAKDRAACALHETEAGSLRDSMATLSRSHKYYSRQLALLSRQHAQWVSSVSLPSIQHQLTQAISHTNSSASDRGAASNDSQEPQVRAISEAPSENQPVGTTKPNSAATRAAHCHSSLVMEALRQDMQSFLAANLDKLASGGASTAGTGSSRAAVQADFACLPSSEDLLEDWRQSTSIVLPADRRSRKPKIRSSGKQRRVRDSASSSTCLDDASVAASEHDRDSQRSTLSPTSTSSTPLPTLQQQHRRRRRQQQQQQQQRQGKALVDKNVVSTPDRPRCTMPPVPSLSAQPGPMASETNLTAEAQSYAGESDHNSIGRSALDWEGWAASARDDTLTPKATRSESGSHSPSDHQPQAKSFGRSASPTRSTSSGRPRTRDRPRDMLEGVIYTVWERVHGEAEQWVQQATLLARSKADMVRMVEENRNLRQALQEAKNLKENQQKELNAKCLEDDERAATVVRGADSPTYGLRE